VAVGNQLTITIPPHNFIGNCVKELKLMPQHIAGRKKDCRSLDTRDLETGQKEGHCFHLGL